ncbi:hypothetical protein DTL42_08290 [Bremerella cremea]|uniref:Calcineurin-like phosphoesterase domain-containing protein n=1 Tax=Bremerella cremea TaxID=1031537 RepID=A0A368KTE4_9BACT|nr:metallophosphoesterase [Bremerella cremea]RCS52823.1 hypothetical protein DTL42_08290 [Bremerella cremea]
MQHVSRRIFRWVIPCFCWFWLLVSAQAAEFLVISDIHFNPMAGVSREQFHTLQQLPAERWGAYFDSLKQPPVSYGQDSNYTLMTSALDAAKVCQPQPAFVLYPGDFLAHDWQAQYDRLAPETIAENPQAYRDFTKQALAVVACEFGKRFPQTPVLATLGNEDSYCGDYWIQPGGPFLASFAKVWQPLLRDTVEAETFSQSFASLGAFRAELPGLPADRLLVLNSVFWSGSYCCAYHAPGKQNCCDCTAPGPQPGRAMMAWLKEELAQARAEQKRVWLLMHVPPGLDSYVEEQDSGKSKAAELWTAEFTTRYLALIDEYRDVLHVSFTGHTHMDDYRVDRIQGEPILLHKIAPAVSPIFGNNPAFQVFQVDDQTAVVTNWQVHYGDLAAAQHATLSWQQEYDARASYGIERVTAPSINRLFTKMRLAPQSRAAEAYRQFYQVSSTPITQKDLPIFLCTVLNSTFDKFSKCLQLHGLAKPTHFAEPAELRRNAGGLGPPKR